MKVGEYIMSNIDFLRAALNHAVDSLGGEDKAVEICDRMYTTLFVGSKPFPASDVFEDFSEEPCDDFYGLDDEDYEFIYKETPKFSLSGLTPCTLIVAMVNYKGEQECYAKWDDVKHLPVFVSKDESFFQVM